MHSKQLTMDKLLSNIKIEVPEGIYLKNPESSELGKKIVQNSIILIDEIGFESFNFKKLGLLIGSNESSVYRYFESKHKLLIYLSSWYWRWLEYQLVIETFSIKDSKEKLEKAVEIVTRTTKEDQNFSHINEILLNKIIINENSKSYLTKSVDSENKQGYFLPYKRVVRRLADIISEYNNKYEFPLSLASSVTEGALHQQFMTQHFTSITNCNESVTPTQFYSHLVIKTLTNDN
ncbi:Regulatory protein, TetR family [Tenacibaculum jejuense]|uniref:Regulatory protein, TetR family n=2 Tax=Tenacibaculum jejuense TaxID=584609 RepID=A0A238U9M4_9FLAO|nr:Regulatory protein, TetR family [Tenacibaculum jejuense]